MGGEHSRVASETPEAVGKSWKIDKSMSIDNMCHDVYIETVSLFNRKKKVSQQRTLCRS